jgi:molybdate transport system permease protein
MTASVAQPSIAPLDGAVPPGRGRSGSSRSVSRQRPWDVPAVVLLAGGFALFLGLPVLTLIGRSLLDGSLLAVAGSSAVLAALGLSLATTAISLVLTVAIGLPLAVVLARRSFRGKWLVEAVVDLPIVLPPAVAGLALLLVLGRRGLLAGPLQAAGLDIAFTTLAVILAQTFVSAPFFVRAARTGIGAVDVDLEDAARVDGATEGQLFRRVTVPLASGALAAGLVMSWARALGEFGATIMFAGNVEGRTQTLPLVVYAEFQAGELDSAIAAGAILALAALGVLVAVRIFHWGRILDVRSVG